MSNPSPSNMLCYNILVAGEYLHYAFILCLYDDCCMGCGNREMSGDTMQVHAPVFDAGSVLQLALFRETGPRTSRRTSMVGMLRLRLSSLAPEVLHCAQLPLCASRQKGGARTAFADLCIKARS